MSVAHPLPYTPNARYDPGALFSPIRRLEGFR